MSHRNDPTLSSHIFNLIFCHINPFRFLDYRNRAGLLGKNRYNRIHKHLRLKKNSIENDNFESHDVTWNVFSDTVTRFTKFVIDHIHI